MDKLKIKFTKPPGAINSLTAQQVVVDKFEDWEESFETLEDCCIGKFRYDYEGCCQSNGMGGCV